MKYSGDCQDVTFSSWSHFQGLYSKEKYVSRFVTVKRIMERDGVWDVSGEFHRIILRKLSKYFVTWRVLC